MNRILAHSAYKDKPAHGYGSHISGVVTKVKNNLEEIRNYISPELFDLMESILLPAANYHDLGKLDKLNQKVLNDEYIHKHLPVEHRDAGVKFLKDKYIDCFAVTLVYAHHKPGLPNINDEKYSNMPFRFREASIYTDKYLNEYLLLHEQELSK